MVAVDFSPHSAAALRQAAWLAKINQSKVVRAHTERDLRMAVHGTSYEAKLNLMYGEGELFQQEVRKEADLRMRRMIAELNSIDLDVKFETLLGAPFVA